MRVNEIERKGACIRLLIIVYTAKRDSGMQKAEQTRIEHYIFRRFSIHTHNLCANTFSRIQIQSHTYRARTRTHKHLPKCHSEYRTRAKIVHRMWMLLFHTRAAFVWFLPIVCSLCFFFFFHFNRRCVFVTKETVVFFSLVSSLVFRFSVVAIRHTIILKRRNAALIMIPLTMTTLFCRLQQSYCSRDIHFQRLKCVARLFRESY